MSHIQSFVSRHALGTRIDTDGVPKGEIYQCVDVAKAYANEEFGVPLGAYGNAIDYWDHTAGPLTAKFDRIETKDVKEDDIVVFRGLPGNTNGHIGVATGSIISGAAAVLEQNGSTGNGQGTGSDTLRFRYITQSRIAGVLRPKAVAPAPAPAPAPEPAPQAPAPAPAGISVGDHVFPNNLVDYDGTPVHAWDSAYTVTEIRADRAVLSARGAVWAAVRTDNLHKV